MEEILCRSGGIGRRAGFKIQFSQESRGSIPLFGTKKPRSVWVAAFLFFANL